MPKPSFYEGFSKGLADAVTDIRQKAVEEPWFGKEVTESAGWPEAREKESPQRQPEMEQEQDQDLEEEIDL